MWLPSVPFPAHFRREIAKIPWELFLPPVSSISFNVTTHTSKLYHSDAVEDAARQGVLQRMQEFYGTEQKGADEIIHIRIENDLCTISLDAAGRNFYRRGYRDHTPRAPLRETTASAMAGLFDLSKYGAIINPMCGAGTLAIEARLRAEGFIRSLEGLPIARWPFFRDAQARDAEKHITSSSATGVEIIAFDSSRKELDHAQRAMKAANLSEAIALHNHDLFSPPSFDIPSGQALLLINPPYGKRLSLDDTIPFYKKMGESIRRWYSTADFAIIVPGIEEERSLGLSFDEKLLFMNGGLKVALLLKGHTLTRDRR